MKRRDRLARNIQGLERWLTDWAAEQSMTPGRLRRRVGMIAIAAMIDDLNRPEPRFIFKGGAAFEFRFGDKEDRLQTLTRSSSGISTKPSCFSWLRSKLDGLGSPGRLIDDGLFEVPGVPIPPRRATAKLTYKRKHS